MNRTAPVPYRMPLGTVEYVVTMVLVAAAVLVALSDAPAAWRFSGAVVAVVESVRIGYRHGKAEGVGAVLDGGVID